MFWIVLEENVGGNEWKIKDTDKMKYDLRNYARFCWCSTHVDCFNNCRVVEKHLNFNEETGTVTYENNQVDIV